MSFQRGMSATYHPSAYDDYYQAPATPELVAPAPQRYGDARIQRIDREHLVNENGC